MCIPSGIPCATENLDALWSLHWAGLEQSAPCETSVRWSACGGKRKEKT